MISGRSQAHDLICQNIMIMAGMICFVLDIVLCFSAFLIDVNYMSDIFIFCVGFCMIFARFLAELFVFARLDGVMVVFFASFLARLNFVVITTNYIVVQSSDAYPPSLKKIAQKIILLYYFYVVLFPHFKFKIHKILYPHKVLPTIYGGVFTFCFFFALYPAGVCLTFPP